MAEERGFAMHRNFTSAFESSLYTPNTIIYMHPLCIFNELSFKIHVKHIFARKWVIKGLEQV